MAGSAPLQGSHGIYGRAMADGRVFVIDRVVTKAGMRQKVRQTPTLPNTRPVPAPVA